MRLSEFEQKSIKEAFRNFFGSGEIYLFGSRADDNQRGGDIDLYLCPETDADDMHRKKIKFLAELDLTIGEQKIDVIIAKSENRLIEQEARKHGIKL